MPIIYKTEYADTYAGLDRTIKENTGRHGGWGLVQVIPPNSVNNFYIIIFSTYVDD